MGIFRKRKQVDLWHVGYRLKEWIPELKKVDSEYITDHLRGRGMVYFEEQKKPVRWYIRLTLPFALIFMLLALIYMPFHFMFTGNWGYEQEWIYNWFSELRLT